MIGRVRRTEEQQLDMPPPQTIQFTRRRWDRLFAIATIFACIVSGVCGYLTGHFRYCLVPLSFVVMWVYFRRQTPATCARTQTIEGNPQTIRLLVWLSFILVWTACFFAFDTFVLKNPIRGPLHWYHWLFLVLTVTVMISGCHLIGGTVKHTRANQESDEQHADTERS